MICSLKISNSGILLVGAKYGLKGGGGGELIPAKCRDKFLRCSSSVWVGIVRKHHDTLTKHAASLVLDHKMQFLKCLSRHLH
jgi:hypothetical protein